MNWGKLFKCSEPVSSSVTWALRDLTGFCIKCDKGMWRLSSHWYMGSVQDTFAELTPVIIIWLPIAMKFRQVVGYPSPSMGFQLPLQTHLSLLCEPHVYLLLRLISSLYPEDGFYLPTSIALFTPFSSPQRLSSCFESCHPSRPSTSPSPPGNLH